jgi:Uma2 family endonuclease
MATVPSYLEKKAAVPPLRQGDRLTPDEFVRRYQAMPKLKKAELIEGRVYMPSPVSIVNHGAPHFDLISWLGVYRAATPGLGGGDNSTVKMNHGDNVPQPDALLWIIGGQCIITEDEYLEGGPDLVAEIASSSVSYDLHEKLRAYQRNRVREYIVWRVEDKVVDWFVLRQGEYKRLKATTDGILKSHIFSGLWLDPDALVRDDINKVLEVLQEGIASPEHRKFVDKLSKNQSKKK